MSRALALVESSDEARTRQNTVVSGAGSLLQTKLFVPQARSELVSRPRLLEALREGETRRLTLVVAPAGFGKTTLLAEWLAESSLRAKNAAWVSLDVTENDPAQFWAYVIAALQRVHAGVGVLATAHLKAMPAVDTGALLTVLINEINSVNSNFTLVLDDYHLIDAEAVHDGVRFLLDHMPPCLHLIVATRAEPPLALSRLRARGELAELHVADMRFTLEEASAFLNSVMDLELSKQDMTVLEQRTEGWIAGLKLAALSMQRRTDVRGFVKEFSGDNRYVADYLVQEVLQSEPLHVRRFLLTTSILGRLSGSLCDAVAGEHGSDTLLEDLERRNLFVVALDERREWYRYHHLFAEVLQKQAARTDANLLRAAHSRASKWHEQHGDVEAAIQHALSADDMERAASLLECSWPPNDRSYRSRQWLDRVRSLPGSIIEARPVLAMGYAWGLLNSGDLEAAEPQLGVVERWLDDSNESATQHPQPVISDETRFHTLPSELEAARVYLAQARGDAPASLEQARRVLDSVSANDNVGRASATALMALAHWSQGELDDAYRTFSQALDIMRSTGHVLDAARGIFVLGDIRVAQGRLREAVRIYEEGLHYSATLEHTGRPETDELYLGLAEVHREWNELSAATKYLETIVQHAKHTSHIGNRLRWCSAMASVHVARGEYNDALALLADGERHERRDPVPRTRPTDAVRARILTVQGHVPDVAAWASSRRLSIDDDLSYLREFAHITLARVLIAQIGEHDARDADRFLERLKIAANTGGRVGSVIETLVLQSIVRHKTGNLRGALDALVEAMSLAEPNGHLRVFLDEGTEMRDLLRHAVARGLATDYAKRVLSAYGKPVEIVAIASTGTAAEPETTLTSRELEILRLIATGMRNQEIADHLDISGATVKRHIANAYGKLGAGHRTEALLKATELKLL